MKLITYIYTIYIYIILHKNANFKVSKPKRKVQNSVFTNKSHLIFLCNECFSAVIIALPKSTRTTKHLNLTQVIKTETFCQTSN